ncbi:NADPH-dependent FMN reductase [Eudoraea chungangensis]|uniref:NADPH-dependent FMN reductase n=1 Tax=Eudoraea chungangensis TaxID=1481905 RepID=UPI0023ED59A8|nr:NAD(P)H-dependent oxidoreductase [Eudoraea chungangensis]
MAAILAFAGSNSSTSINYKLISYTANQLSDQNTTVLNMALFPFPMYSADYEKENGFSNSLVELCNDIKKSDGLVISVNEHNGNPSAYFKNLIDWLSRVDRNFLAKPKILLMATSGGKRGAQSSMEVTEKLLGRFGGEVVATFSLPSFYEQFDAEAGIKDSALRKNYEAAINTFVSKL